MAETEKQTYKNLCKEFLDGLSRNNAENNQLYSEYAKNYDSMLQSIEYSLPVHIAAVCKKHVPAVVLNGGVILDIACGTGLSGEGIRNGGFSGPMDGIESCSDMIEVAKKKNIYREIKQQQLSPETRGPFPDNIYDVITCIGALVFGHVPHECLRDMIRMLKVGGILIFNVGKLHYDKNSEALQSVENVLTKLIEEGKCRIVEKTNDVLGYSDESKLHKIHHTTIFCVTKLK